MILKDINSEKCLIGCMLTDNKIINEVSLQITEDDLFSIASKDAYNVIREEYYKNKYVDLVVVDSKLNNNAYLFLTECCSLISTAQAYPTYIRLIKECTLKRQLKSAADKCLEVISRNVFEDINDLYSKCVKGYTDIKINTSKRFTDSKDVFINLLEDLDKQEKKENNIKYHLSWLDGITSGLFNQEITILAARPGCGKTAFALQLGIRNAMSSNKVAIFNLEMSNKQMMTRIIANVAVVNGMKIRANKLDKQDYEKINKYTDTILNLPIKFYDDITSIELISAEARRLKANKDLELLIIDYIQLIKTSDKFNSENSSLTYVSRELKLLAKELDIPILILSQFSREGDSSKLGKNERPKLIHLRGSGAIEQDADVVMFLHNPNQDNERGIKKEAHVDIEILIAKHRAGESNLCNDLRFYTPYQKFGEISKYIKANGG
jgi:replicative DNA helicase